MSTSPVPAFVAAPIELGGSKNLRVIQLVARDLLIRVEGERIPTALHYQRLTGAGSGTVQKALRTLQSAGAVTLQSRGHTGTYLMEVDLPKLWALATIGAPTAVLPVPSSLELMGLARALRMELRRLGIPYQALYTYGSRRRLALVEEGEADFTALSAVAADELVTASGGEWFAAPLSSNSYYFERSWIVMVRPGLDPNDDSAMRRIGIDRSSHDQSVLTEAEFPLSRGRRYIDGDYTYMPAQVARGKLDTMIWHQSVLAIPLEAAGISSRPLNDPQAVKLVKKMNRAMLVAKTSRPELARMFALLDRRSISRLQAEVHSGEVPPFY
jgi:hypothetical protein